MLDQTSALAAPHRLTMRTFAADRIHNVIHSSIVMRFIPPNDRFVFQDADSASEVFGCRVTGWDAVVTFDCFL